MANFVNRWKVYFYTHDGTYIEFSFGIRTIAGSRELAIDKAKEHLNPGNIKSIAYIEAEIVGTVEVV